ncbi:MAG: spore germination protein GerW family protein [Actinomycetota bacterium]
MTTEMAEATATVMRELDDVRDAMRVGRVFGDPYEHDGVTIIPAARVAGGGGGGGDAGDAQDAGFGTGFGLSARPVGMIVIDRDGGVAWRPTVDATAVARGGQALAAIAAICVTLVLLRKR